MKIGLVLEGGGMRSLYSAGIMDLFIDEGITADCVVGVSAGSLFGVNLLSKQRGRALRYNKRFNREKDYMGLRPYIREGNFVSTDYAYDYVPRVYDPFDDETFKNSKSDFYAVVTNVDTGEAEYIHVKSVFDQMDVLRASSSMPVVSKMVEIDGQNYLDGGIADSIPFEWVSKQGCDKVIVILTRDANYKKKPMSPLMGIPYKKKYPKLVEKMMARHKIYNRSLRLLKKWEDSGRAFVFRPSEPISISRMEKNPDNLQAVYDLGVKDGKTLMESLKKYLEI